MSGGARDGHAGQESAERGLAVLMEAAERAVDKIASSVPSAQLRALLLIDCASCLNLSRLAARLGASASATSRLCDRMQAAGLLTRDPAAQSRREITLSLTGPGHRLAGWTRDQRRAALADLLQAMSPDGREALLRGLGELAMNFR